jgi:shikimate kinase
MPGSGKSTIGRMLARKLNVQLIDLDEYIIQKEKLSIPQLFKTKGEDYFRNAETQSLQELLKKKTDCIVSVGGGTPCYNNNMSVMKAGGKSIYLKTSPAELARRVEADDNSRPLLAKLNGRKLIEKLTSMLAHREKFYAQANFTIVTDGKTAEAIADEVGALL